MDPEDKDYVCTLTEQSLEKAKKELNEDPKERLGAVQTLRAWIRAQPHLVSRTDTLFLLNVLRTAKFSQLKAREKIETILTMMTLCPEYMVNLDTHEPGILHYIDKGSTISLPNPTAKGEKIVIIRVGATDLKDPVMTIANEMRAGLAVMELGNEFDEDVIVNGFHLVFDMTDSSLKHFTRGSSTEDKNTTKIYQDCNIGRMKGFHLYNGGGLIEVIIGFMKTFMKKKFVERTHVHSTMESLYKQFPMELWPQEYLPDDYKGPSVGSVKTLTDDMKKRLTEPGFRARLLDHTQEKYKIDNVKKENSAPQESFRKLNID